MLQVACPKCAKPLGLPDSVAGKPVKCPNCHQPFIAPALAKAGAPRPKPAAARQPAKHEDDITPYAVLPEVEKPPEIIEAQTSAVDDMVIAARRQKKRNKAWEAVGLPTKYMKRFALLMVVLWLSVYLFLTVIIVLCNHNLEKIEKGQAVEMRGGKPDLPRYLFVEDIDSSINPRNLRPLHFWLICTGGLIVAMAIYGLQLAGAESMKKLENYPLAMFAMIVGALTINLFCIWGLLVMTDKDVKYEFRVSKRRMEGVTGEELYEEGDDEEEEEGDEEEAEEEEEEPAPARRRK
jgi:hypothetical protein